MRRNAAYEGPNRRNLRTHSRETFREVNASFGDPLNPNFESRAFTPRDTFTAYGAPCGGCGITLPTSAKAGDACETCGLVLGYTPRERVEVSDTGGYAVASGTRLAEDKILAKRAARRELRATPEGRAALAKLEREREAKCAKREAKRAREAGGKVTSRVRDADDRAALRATREARDAREATRYPREGLTPARVGRYAREDA